MPTKIERVRAFARAHGVSKEIPLAGKTGPTVVYDHVGPENVSLDDLRETFTDEEIVRWVVCELNIVSRADARSDGLKQKLRSTRKLVDALKSVDPSQLPPELRDLL